MSKEKGLNESDIALLKDLCELNENLTLSTTEANQIFIYKSRFLHIDVKNNLMVIDEPSPETPNAKPLSKGQSFRVFFVYRNRRLLFSSKVLEHSMFKIKERGFYALKILAPVKLEDGERREFFRVETPSAPAVLARFNIFKYDFDKGTVHIPDSIGVDTEEFEAQIINISGGGIGLKGLKNQKPLDLNKGDIVNARFKLRADIEEMEVWSEVRYRRSIQDAKVTLWGIQFMDDGQRNPNLKLQRNKIMRYVIERQREMMVK